MRGESSCALDGPFFTSDTVLARTRISCRRQWSCPIRMSFYVSWPGRTAGYCLFARWRGDRTRRRADERGCLPLLTELSTSEVHDDTEHGPTERPRSHLCTWERVLSRRVTPEVVPRPNEDGPTQRNGPVLSGLHDGTWGFAVSGTIAGLSWRLPAGTEEGRSLAESSRTP